MFGWFQPTCPCDPAAKGWIEERLQWLSKEFGLHILLERPIILPTSEFFPDPWDGTPGAVRSLCGRVCQYMGVARDALKLELFTDRQGTAGATLGMGTGFAAATWQNRGPGRPSVLRVERSTLDNVSDLVGTLAHELAHQRLLGEGRADVDAYDNELLTDLTAVFHGFGVFLANNRKKSTGELSHWPGTKLYRPEYLSIPMLGYALAHVAWFRDEDRPAWARYLGWTPHAVWKQGLRYLQKTGDSTFLPVRLRGTRIKEQGDR